MSGVPAVVAHARGEREQAPDVGDRARRDHDLHDVRAPRRIISSYRPSRSTGMPSRSWWETIEALRPTFSTITSRNPLRMLDVDVVEAALHRLPGASSRRRGSSSSQDPPSETGRQVRTSGRVRARRMVSRSRSIDEVGADLEEVGQPARASMRSMTPAVVSSIRLRRSARSPFRYPWEVPGPGAASSILSRRMEADAAAQEETPRGKASKAVPSRPGRGRARTRRRGRGGGGRSAPARRAG